MKFYFITFRSVTFAQRGEQVLNKAGIRCTLQRTPRWMESQGCGYSLRIWTADVKASVELLRDEGVPMRKVYVQGDNGVLEEVAV
ncbi:MAG: DUF3343 domain-containing protein [Oscillospiraceae bacterium]|nr:DUF3343 domain-containing protein [Oscillospiraceae bacterium]